MARGPAKASLPCAEECLTGLALAMTSTTIVAGFVGRVFDVADALLNLAFDLLGTTLDLLALVVRRIAEGALRLAGDVLEFSFRLIAIQEVSFRMQRPLAASV